MKKEDFLHALQNLRKDSKKRKFSQTVDLIVNLEEVDTKFNLDTYVHMPHDSGKGVKICAVVDTLAKQAEELVDKVVNKEELGKLDAKQVSQIAKDYDIFIAEASLMGQLATVLGRTLGPLGKMPNPKAGGVVMPDEDMKANVSKFKSDLRLKNKAEAIVKVVLGKEDFEDEKLVENGVAVYDAIVHALPHAERNVKNVLIKFTMSKPVRVGKKVKVEEDKETEEKKEEPKEEKPKPKKVSPKEKKVKKDEGKERAE
jgi:large subunit ribosomal protein L1